MKTSVGLGRKESAARFPSSVPREPLRSRSSAIVVARLNVGLGVPVDSFAKVFALPSQRIETNAKKLLQRQDNARVRIRSLLKRAGQVWVAPSVFTCRLKNTSK